MILRIVEFLVKVFCRVIFRIEISGMENIPENGKTNMKIYIK